MKMQRPRSICVACGELVEWYSDGLDGRNAPLRCGNCFQGISYEQYAKLEAVQKRLDELQRQRDQVVQEFLARG